MGGTTYIYTIIYILQWFSCQPVCAAALKPPKEAGLDIEPTRAIYLYNAGGRYTYYNAEIEFCQVPIL